jgi:tetratricopeptide (TPR) repeat protein
MKTIARAVRTGQGALLGAFVVLLLWSPVLASPPDEGQGRGPGQSAGQLSAADALSALRMSVGLRPADTRVDLDKDEAITSNDSRLILLCVVGKCPPEIVAERNREQCLEYRGQAEELAAQRRWPEVAALIEKARSAPLLCAEKDFASLQEQVRAVENLCREHQARIEEGEALCLAQDWEACQERLPPALEGVAEDCPELAEGAVRARQLLAQAEAELANAAKAKEEQAKAAKAKEEQLRKEQARKEQEEKTRCDELFNQARAKGEKNDHKGAIALYRKVLEHCPDNCSAMNNLGAQYDKLGQLEKAKPWFEKAASCAPDKELYRNNLAKVQKRLQKKTPKTSPKISKDKCDALHEEALAFSKSTKDHKAAIARYQEVLEVCPRQCRSMNGVGANFARLGDDATAVKWYKKAVECDPSYTMAKDNLARCESRLSFVRGMKMAEANDIEGSLATMHESLRKDPKNCSAMIALATIEEKRNNPKAALAWYDKAIACDPKNEKVKQHAAKLRQSKPVGRPEAKRTETDQGKESKTPAKTGAQYDGTYRGAWYAENAPGEPVGTLVLTVHKSNATVKLYDANTGKERDSRLKISGHVDASGNLSLTNQSGSPWRGKIASSQAQGTWEAVVLGKTFRGTWRATLQKQ